MNYKIRRPTEETSRQRTGSLNAGRIRHLYKCSNLQTIHNDCLYWHVWYDDDYRYLKRHFREDGAVRTYLERSGLEAFLVNSTDQ